ncbi:MAG: hypothetical protein OXU75_02250 [Deltaproteobacteria bacterium]|nr:hypothetical protein [Deltaproteobacteria bacterium]
MTPGEWIAAGQLAVAAAGVALVWNGIWQMRRAGDQREERENQRHREVMAALTKTDEAREKREDTRHAEAMRALDSQAEAREKREDARHAEAMRALDSQAEALRAVVQGMQQQTAALQTVIERTAGRA